MASALVTGANRGIGLGIVQNLLKRPEFTHVFATTRGSGEEELRSIKDPRLHILTMDVVNDKQIETAVSNVREIVGDSGLNYLINNAGIMNSYDFEGPVNPEQILMELQVNAISPTVIAQFFTPLLRASAKTGARTVAVTITSTAASLQFNASHVPGLGSYKISKAAANMAMRDHSACVKNDGIIVASFCPGWVKTDMGGSSAFLTVDESVSSLMESIVVKLTLEHNGGFFNRELNAIEF